MYKLGTRSKNNLKGVHTDLKKIVERAITTSTQDFTVIEGRRTKARQRELFKSGFSKTMNSRHLTGHAVDIIPYPIPADWRKYRNSQWKAIAKAMLEAADHYEVDLQWGFEEWGWDKPHYQLSWQEYPNV